MDPILSAADEDSIQLVGEIHRGDDGAVPVRWSQWLGIHKAPEAFGIYRDLFRRRQIARILRDFLWTFRMLQVGNIYIEYEYGPWILKITRS